MFDKSKIVIKNEAETSVRFLNFIIDHAVIQVLTVLLTVILGLMLVFTGNENTLNAFAENRVLSLSLSVFLTFRYYFFMENFTNGRTIGKLLTGTTVVTDYGSKPSTGAFMLRTLSRFMPFEAFSFFSANGKWHDTWTDTVVVKKKAFENDLQTLQNEIDIENLGKNDIV